MLDTFFINAPEGQRWPLDIDTVDQRFQGRFPGMRGWIKQAPDSREDYLSFDLEIDGTTRTGAYYGGGPLILRDGDEGAWASTIAWFLSLLPSGTPAVAMRASSPEQIDLLPADPNAAQIQRALEDLDTD